LEEAYEAAEHLKQAHDAGERTEALPATGEDLSDVGVAVITNRTGKLCWGMKGADSPIMVLGGLAGLGVDAR
jgi:hypothetical protein